MASPHPERSSSSTVRPALLAALLGCLALARPAGGQERGFLAARLLPDAEAGAVRLVGDADGDGDADLVQFLATDGGPGAWESFRTLRNDGPELVPLVATSLRVPSGGSAATLPPRLGDVTGDGVPDVVVDLVDPLTPTGAGQSGLLVFPGAGDGTFGAPVAIVAGGDVLAFALGELDGAPGRELGVLHSGNDTGAQPHLRWWSFDGSGLTPSAPLHLGVPTPASTLAEILAVDLTGDGVDDLVATRGTPPAFLAFFPTLGGAPNQGPQLPLPAGLQTATQALLGGDLEGDGDADVLVVARPDGAGATRFQPFVQLAPGSFTLLPASEAPDPRPGFELDVRGALADWDGDLDLDLLAGGEHLACFEHDGAGAFAFASEAFLGPDLPSAGAADVDGDGRIDHVGARTLLLGDGRFPGHQPPGEPPIPVAAPRAADWEDDGDVDLFASGGVVHANDGRGVYASQGPLFPTPPAGHFFGAEVAVDDLTGDGRLDYLVPFFAGQPFPLPPTFLSMVLIADDGVDGFDAGIVAAPLGVQIPRDADARLAAADLDGDGDRELLTTDGYWRNDGGVFAGSVTPAYTGRPRAAVDVDDDADVDVIAVDAGQLVLLRNRGGAAFAVEPLGVATAEARVTALDVEGDGDLDLVAVDEGDDALALYENLGVAFAPALLLPSPGAHGLRVAAADVTGDGVPDLLGARATTGGLELVTAHPAVGPLVFGERIDWVARSAVERFFDADSDGDLDAVGAKAVRGAREQAGLVRQLGAGAPGAAGVVPVLGAFGPMVVGSPTARLVTRRGLGGTTGFLVTGNAPASLVLPFAPNVTLLVDSFVLLTPILLGGPQGTPGLGTFDFVVDPGPSLAGTHFFHQVVLFDPSAPFGLSASNALETIVGE